SPYRADPLQLACHRARGAAELGSDLFIAPTFHLPQCHRPQLQSAQAAQESFAFFGHLGGEFRTGLPAQELFEPPCIFTARGRRGSLYQAAAPLLPGLMAPQTGGLTRRDDDQQPPQAVAIAEIGEMALLGMTAETVKRTQGHILFVGGPWPRAAELL